VAEPSNLAKLVPTTVTERPPRVRVFGWDNVVSSQKSNENKEDKVVSRSWDASGSMARVATTDFPYDAPVIARTRKLESDTHPVVSHAEPPNLAVGEYSTRPKFIPLAVMENRPEVGPLAGKNELRTCAS
jgi:hypothetical protein